MERNGIESGTETKTCVVVTGFNNCKPTFIFGDQPLLILVQIDLAHEK